MKHLSPPSRCAAGLGTVALVGPLLAALLLVLAGCYDANEKAPAAATQSETSYEVMEDVHVYTVRGVIRRMPDPNMPGRPELQILHEAIPNWVNSEGYETGMQGMTMPFLVADGVSLDGLEPGSRVQFTFEVDWEESTMLLTEIEPYEEMEGKAEPNSSPASPAPGDSEETGAAREEDA